MHTDESALYTALREASVPTERWCTQKTTLAVAGRLGMRTVRLDELLAGWARAGWWEDGSEWFVGHFTDKAPQLLDVMKRASTHLHRGPVTIAHGCVVRGEGSRTKLSERQRAIVNDYWVTAAQINATYARAIEDVERQRANHEGTTP